MITRGSSLTGGVLLSNVICFKKLVRGGSTASRLSTEQSENIQHNENVNVTVNKNVNAAKFMTVASCRQSKNEKIKNNLHATLYLIP